MNIAIITIGRRDITLKSKFPHDVLECRKNGQYILDNFSQLKAKIELPIIEPFLEYLAERSIKIDKYALIVTDQKDENFQKSDTIIFAKVLKLFLKKDNNEVFIISLKQNVIDFNFNFSYFQKTLKQNLTDDLEKVFLLPVGGIPNINTPLIMASLMIFREKVEQFFVDEKHSNCLPVPFGKKLLKEIENERIKTALDSYFFASIRDICSDKFIRMIADYTYNRLSFNLAKAKLIADDMIMEFPNENLAFMSESITDIRNSFQEKIKEIFFTAIIKIKQNQYIDALLRLYSFTDNLLMQRVCILYNLEYNSNTNFEKWWKSNAYTKILKDNPDIENKLKINNIDKPDLKRSGIPLYEELIRLKDNKDKVLEVSTPLIHISRLRNKSIAAHGFEGVSLEKINEKLVKFELNLNDLIKEIETYLGFRFKESCYYRIENKIRNDLDKYTYSDDVGPRQNYF